MMQPDPNLEKATATAFLKRSFSLARFLVETAPGVSRDIPHLFHPSIHGRNRIKFAWPELQLHCDGCKGVRFCDPGSGDNTIGQGEADNTFIDYHCRNCRGMIKRYAIFLRSDREGNDGHVLKIGEFSLFGIEVEDDLQHLIESDKELFLKGVRAESVGLGLAAFVYYRRVVESQRTHLFDEIIGVARHVNAGTALIERLERLRETWRFQQSVDEIKDCVPSVLLMEGRNPLELLHPVLSDNLHDRTDEEALEIAKEIRLVLVELAKRMALVRSESDELKTAISRLDKRKKERDLKFQKQKPNTDASDVKPATYG